MSVLVGALVPLLSVLLGAALTYWLNVRSRRRSYVDDLFRDAIAAVAVAEASKSYLREVGRPLHMTERDHREVLSWIARTSVEKHTQRAGEAREALARVMPYVPDVRALYLDAEAVLDRSQEIIDLLRRSRARQSE